MIGCMGFSDLCEGCHASLKVSTGRVLSIMKLSLQLPLRMNIVLLLLTLIFSSIASGDPAPIPVADETPRSLWEKCLPTPMKLTDVVEVKTSRGDNGQAVLTAITVEQRLTELKATVDSQMKLIDGSQRPILFYHLIGCWGHPPPNYQELLQQQRSEIEALKHDNTVIEMTCNPSAAKIP